MDKKTLTKVCLVCVLTLAAGSAAYASSNITGTTILNAGSGTFGTSSNVTISIDSTSQAYAAFSQHLNGDRVFWGSNAEPRLYYTNKATGSTTSVTPSATMTAPANFSSM